METNGLQAAVRDEVEALHRFFVDWFTGSASASDEVFERSFTERFEDDFLLIAPAGTLLGRSELSEGVRRGHGSNPRFRIAIRDTRVRQTWDDAVLATYQEWQRHALASTPPDNGRLATVLFRRRGGRLRWQHVHETWLPEEVMRSGPYNF